MPSMARRVPGPKGAVDGGVVVALVGERLLQLAAFLAGEPSLGGTRLRDAFLAF